MATKWREEGPRRLDGGALRAMAEGCPDRASATMWRLCCREAAEFGAATIPLVDLGDGRLTTGVMELVDEEEDEYVLQTRTTPRGEVPGGVV